MRAINLSRSKAHHKIGNRKKSFAAYASLNVRYA